MRTRLWVLVALGLAIAVAGCSQEDGSAPAGPLPTPNDTGLRFAVLGDFGSGSASQQAVADRMCNRRSEHPFDLVITTGDNVYESGHPRRFEPAFFAPYACLLDDGVRFRAILGNHDIVTRNGRPELNEPAFGMKARDYVVRKAGVRFVMVDSNRLRLGWLENHLTPKDGDRWTIVVLHHPVFSTGAHGSTPGFRPSLPRLFKSFDVDLVLNGHDHNYEVTKKLGGIRYVTTGGGGAILRPCGEPAWFTDTCASRNHFLYVKAGEDRITVKAVGVAGQPFDVFRTRGRS